MTQKNPPTPFRIQRVTALLFLLLTAVACGGRATPTPVTTRAIVPTATTPLTPILIPPTTRAVDPTPTTRITPTTGTAHLVPFAFPFPPTWQYLLISGPERVDVLQEIANANPALAEWIHPLSITNEHDPAWLIAWPTDHTAGVGLLAYTTPRMGLTIQRYLEALQRRLAEQNDIVVEEAMLDYMIHDDHPVGYLHYTLANAASNTSQTTATVSQTVVTGYQYLFFDEDATSLLVMNFVLHHPPATIAQAGNEETIRDEFTKIVQAVTTDIIGK